MDLVYVYLHIGMSQSANTRSVNGNVVNDCIEPHSDYEILFTGLQT